MHRAIQHLWGVGPFLVPCLFFLAASSTVLAALEESTTPSTVGAMESSQVEQATADEAASPTDASSETTFYDQLQDEAGEPHIADAYPADAFQADSYIDPVVPGDISMGSVILKLSPGLGVVILLVWGSVTVLKKSSLGKQLSSNTGRIRVIERSYLGPKKSICLVRIGQRALALGVTESSITMLAQLDDEELPAVADLDNGNGASFVAQFRSILSNKQSSGRLGGEVTAS